MTTPPPETILTISMPPSVKVDIKAHAKLNGMNVSRFMREVWAIYKEHWSKYEQDAAKMAKQGE